MKVFFLYHQRSEDARRVEEYVYNFKRQRGKDIDLVSLDTRDGAATASLYDVMRSPALLVTRDDGQLMGEWEGTEAFPLMNELASYIAV